MYYDFTDLVQRIFNCSEILTILIYGSPTASHTRVTHVLKTIPFLAHPL